MKLFLATIIILLLSSGAFIFICSNKETSSPISTTSPIGNIGEPMFTWKYTPVIENEIPKTQIALIATYTNNSIQTKDIDVVDGSCNDYSNPDQDVYEHSSMIICYGAGLGHYFKIVEKKGTYHVMRKIFEEGSPDYVPPEQQFETINQF